MLKLLNDLFVCHGVPDYIRSIKQVFSILGCRTIQTARVAVIDVKAVLRFDS